MARRVWFTQKRYGYGWVPATWEGWVVVGTYIVVVIANFLRIDSQSPSISNTMISFIPEMFVLTFVFIYVCIKTGDRRV